MQVNVKAPGHPVLAGIPWQECPVFEGFDRIIPRMDAQVLATIGTGEDENPLIVVRKFGEGRTMAFASDCSPHWAAFFQPWAYYKTFWQKAVRWLAGGER